MEAPTSPLDDDTAEAVPTLTLPAALKMSLSPADQDKETSQEQRSRSSTSQQGPPSRKVLIVGGGVAGLTLALALKRLSQQNQGLNIQPIVFEKKETYTERGVHYILWRWVVELLLEMGLGKRLGHIAWPVLNFRSFDADSKQVLVQWPPGSDNKSHPLPDSTEDQGDPSLPPMLGVRQVDLIRLLLLGWAGIRDELLDSLDFVVSGANNSDVASDVCEGFDADLARGNWFEREKWRRVLPDLRLGHELESYTISPVTGKVTVLFKNGLSETGDMLIGADGVKSVIRDALKERPFPPQHAGAAVFSGITRIHIPPVDTQTELEDGRFIEDMTKEDIYTFCPDGTAISIMGRGLAFGVTNIGNGMLGWNFVVAQNEPGEHIEKIIMNNRKNAISAVLAHNPRSSIIMNPNVLSMKQLADGSTASTDQLSSAINNMNLTPSSSVPNSRPTTPLSRLLDPVSSDELSGTEIRTLALRLCLPLTLPHPSHAIMARTDPDLITVHDVMDLADDYPVSFGDPNSHPGRVMLIGDAAHAVATNAHGSVGAGLAVGDAALLAKLLGKYLDPMSTSKDADAFLKICGEFDEMRANVCSTIVKEARSEGPWCRTENVWVKLLRFGQMYTTHSWAKASYSTMLTRGRISLVGLPSLQPPEHHQVE